MADDRRLIELGVPPPLVRELAKQAAAGRGDAVQLMRINMPSVRASEVATQIRVEMRGA